MISRDSAFWWFGLIGAIVTTIAVNLDRFPWFSEEARQWISLVAVVVAAVSGKLATSPLPSKQAAAVGTATAKVVDAQRDLIHVKSEQAAKAEEKLKSPDDTP